MRNQFGLGSGWILAGAPAVESAGYLALAQGSGSGQYGVAAGAVRADRRPGWIGIFSTRRFGRWHARPNPQGRLLRGRRAVPYQRAIDYPGRQARFLHLARTKDPYEVGEYRRRYAARRCRCRPAVQVRAFQTLPDEFYLFACLLPASRWTGWAWFWSAAASS